MMAQKLKNKKLQSLLQLGLFIGVIVFLNILANSRINKRPLYKKWDLTEEKRFTLTPTTKELLFRLDEVVSVKILLEGSFDAGFKRLKTATLEMLEDFRSESVYIEYVFDDPNVGSVEQINQRREELKKDGIGPTRLNSNNATGRSEQYIYPWAIFTYKGRTERVNLLESARGATRDAVEQALNNSIALLEYKFADAIQKLQISRKPVIGFTTGHGELEAIETANLEFNLRKYYDTGRIPLDSMPALSQEANLVIIAKPVRPFSEKDKFKIDQYIMNGGKVLWLLDKIDVNLDSLTGKIFFPRETDTNLDDQLFTYGVRIKPNLVLDLQCSMIPLQTGVQGNKPQYERFPYPYHLVLTNHSSHPVAKSVGPINLRYANTIDTTVVIKTPVEKTVLLQTTPNTRIQLLPLQMDFEFLRYELDAEKFDKGVQPVALLLEGTFPSLYRNRVPGSFLNALEAMGVEFRKESDPTRMIVISDGDIAKNPINPRNGIPEPLGRNPYDQYTYSNKDFLLNAIEYLLDTNGAMAARGKEVKLRLLDEKKTEAERAKWQLINIVAPLVFLLLFGFVYNWVRRKRFA